MEKMVPPDEQQALQGHLKELELYILKLVSRKADFIQERIKEDVERPTQMLSAIRCQPLS